MENARNTRKNLIGFVTSISGDKSIKVTYSYKIPHPRYRKVINRKTVVHVHDESNDARLNDRVEIMETRPISRLKRWRLVRVIERAPIVGGEVKEEEFEQPVVAAEEPEAPAEEPETPTEEPEVAVAEKES